MTLKLISKIALSLLLAFGLTTLSSCKNDNPVDPNEGNNNNNNPGFPVEAIPSFSVGDSRTVSGNVSNGEQLDELDWAALSNVACFPATRFIEFEGNQVFYSVEIPQGAELIVTVTPTGERKRINLYGYIEYNGSNTPPVTSVTSCEAGYELYVGTPDLNAPGEPQDISFAQAVNNGFTALIVVSGARDVLEGEYDLTFELQPM